MKMLYGNHPTATRFGESIVGALQREDLESIRSFYSAPGAVDQSGGFRRAEAEAIAIVNERATQKRIVACRSGSPVADTKELAYGNQSHILNAYPGLRAMTRYFPLLVGTISLAAAHYLPVMEEIPKSVTGLRFIASFYRLEKRDLSRSAYKPEKTSRKKRSP